MLLLEEHVGIGSPALWIGFSVLVLALLALDLGVLNRKAHVPSLREAAALTALWIAIAAAFGVYVFLQHGGEKATEFATGYVVEKALSVDNLFVFLVLFRSLAVPPMYQHRVLFWGILGALVTRGIFIFVGAALLEQFHWMIFVFGGFLVLTGIKLLFVADTEPHPERNIMVRLFRRIFPLTADYHGPHFFVREAGLLKATPLLLAVVAAEATDVLFATDSIPAVFAISRDPFIVYTSNIFAILGLRALYFLLAGIMDRFHYLKYGLASVLIFVGAKMVFGETWKVPVMWSLAIIVGMLGIAIGASLLRPRPAAVDD